MLKAPVMSAINAFTLLVLGGWYFSELKDGYALLSILFAVLMLVMNQGFSNGNKPSRNIVAIVTTASLVNCMPLLRAIQYRDDTAIYIYGGCLATSILSLVLIIPLFLPHR